jgi:hypothetical protein
MMNVTKKTDLRSAYEMGYDAHQDGTNPPLNLTTDQLKEWNRGWRMADKRQQYLLEK